MNSIAVTFESAPPLPDWLAPALPFHRRSAVVDGVRLHFIDEGEGLPVVFFHGNPTWSFLWRKVISALRGQGLRLLAPDLMGLGLSDKPAHISAHSLRRHHDLLAAWLDALALERFVLVGQDWGGPMAGGMAARFPERVAGVLFANTATYAPRLEGRLSSFHRLAATPVISDILFRGFNAVPRGMHKVQGDPKSIGAFERRAYTWPLDSWRNRAAPLALARMVPAGFDHPSVAPLREMEAWARGYSGPAALVWGLRDPILGRSLRSMRELYPRAAVMETEAGHFLQEEVPEVLAEAVLAVARQAGQR